MTDVRRMNVALTRARHQLICVGNVQQFPLFRDKKAGTLKALALDAQSRGAIVIYNDPPSAPYPPPTSSSSALLVRRPTSERAPRVLRPIGSVIQTLTSCLPVPKVKNEYGM
jgi:hypothetical protein